MLKNCRCIVRIVVLLIVLNAAAAAQDKTAPITGQKVYSIGHSFHVFMPGILNEIAQAAEIKEHKQVGLSSIGGSRVIQHWDVADDKFKSKALLTEGKVDVLTMSPIYLPDDGIENFCKLALEHNPNIRISIQEFWLPHDRFNVANFAKTSSDSQPECPVDGRTARAARRVLRQH